MSSLMPCHNVSTNAIPLIACRSIRDGRSGATAVLRGILQYVFQPRSDDRHYDSVLPER